MSFQIHAMPNPSSKPGIEDGSGDTLSSNILWVGYMSADLNESELMDIFTDYGVLDVMISPSMKSYAFAFFMCNEDAKAALDSLHGTSYKGISLKIEFAKPARACKQLWIGGIGQSVTKEKLEESFVRFGKVEEVNFCRERNTALITFSKLEEAALALKSMNGKHLCGDQIRVDYVRSLSTRRFAQSSEGQKVEMPSKVLWIGYPPSIRIDELMLHNAMILFGEIEAIKSFPERNYSFVEFRSIDEARRAKEGLQGRIFNDSRITIMYSSSPGKNGPGYLPGSKVLGTETGYGIKYPVNLLGPGILGRPIGPKSSMEPAFGRHEVVDSNSNRWNAASSVLPGGRQPIRSRGDFDAKQIERDAKRSRVDGFPSNDDYEASIYSHQNSRITHKDEGPADMYSGFQRRSPLPPVAPRLPIGMSNHDHPDNDHIWRGVITKGGTPVCQARCVPVQKGADWELPDVVNCCARTGLDMLEKHYAEALGVEIVYFLPDCEEDFDSYTEFLRYLGDKNRAGVAKLDDSTTLFLVPPSDFLTKILSGAGPKRLYGLVLNLPPAPVVVGTMTKQQLNQPIPSPHASEHQYVPSPQVNYSRVREENSYGYSEDSGLLKKPNFPPAESFKLQPSVGLGRDISNTPVSQPRVTLTPELIATLANIIPAVKQSVAASSQPPATSGSGLSSQEAQSVGTMSYVPQYSSNQYNPQVQNLPPRQTYVASSNGNNNGSVMAQAGYKIAVAPFDQQQNFNFSRPVTNFPVSSQGLPGYQQVNQPYEPESLHNAHSSYGSSRFESQYDPAKVSGQAFGSNLSQSPTSLPKAVVTTEMGHQKSLQQQPYAAPAVSAEADKSLKYQSTLEFAANLLQQIQQRQQQQQQQQSGPGSRNQ